MKIERDSIEVALDNYMIQLTDLHIKMNVLTSMVMNVYNETLPKETFLKIADTYFSQLEQQVKEMYDRMDEHVLYDASIAMRCRMDFLLSIQALRADYGLGS
jgi:hypothetical protein